MNYARALALALIVPSMALVQSCTDNDEYEQQAAILNSLDGVRLEGTLTAMVEEGESSPVCGNFSFVMNKTTSAAEEHGIITFDEYYFNPDAYPSPQVSCEYKYFFRESVLEFNTAYAYYRMTIPGVNAQEQGAIITPNQHKAHAWDEVSEYLGLDGNLTLIKPE